MVICYPNSPNYCLCTTWGKHEPRKLCLFSHAVYTVSRKRHCFGCYIFNTHHLSICRPLSPPARRRTTQCSPVLRQQRIPSATRRTLADNAAGVQERCRTTSHCSARIHALGTSEAAVAVSFLRHGMQHD